MNTQSESSNSKRHTYRPATELVFVDCPEGSGGNHHNASSVPIYQTATFKQTSATQTGEYDYTRSGNPTRSHLGMEFFVQGLFWQLIIKGFHANGLFLILLNDPNKVIYP